MPFTSRGAGLLVGGLVLLAAGFRLGYPELTVLGCGSVIAVGVALAYGAWRPRLRVDRAALPDRVARGEECWMVLTVRRTGRLGAATMVGTDRCGPDSVTIPLVRLGRARASTVEYRVPTLRRGATPIGPLRVSRRDPLGLVALGREYGEPTTVLVYPRVYGLSAVPLGIMRSLDGRADRVPHGSITFDALREYVTGDDLRHVHWRTTARVGALMVREHVDTSRPRLVVVLDDRAAAYAVGGEPGGGTRQADAAGADHAGASEPGDTGGVGDAGDHGAVTPAFEAACEAAASVLALAGREDLPVDLVLVSGADPLAGITAPAGTAPVGTAPAGTARTPSTPVQRGGPAAIRHHMDTLAAVELATELGEADAAREALQACVRRLRQRRLGDTVVLLTGSAEPVAAIGALRGAYPSIMIGILGRPEAPAASLPDLRIFAAVDGGEFARAWDGLGAW
jgi:uncharacterized protein (DUF58 family)